MSSVDELRKLASGWVSAYACMEDWKAKERKQEFLDALTATIDAKDARIAELEREATIAMSNRDVCEAAYKARIAELEESAKRDARVIANFNEKLTGVCADRDEAVRRIASRDERIARLQNERDSGQWTQWGYAGVASAVPTFQPPPTNDDRRRFVDECAMRYFVMGTHDECSAKSAYDAAEALAAERDRRMQP